MTELTEEQSIRNKIDDLYEDSNIPQEVKAKELALMAAVEILKLGQQGATITLKGSAKITIAIQQL
ncbi:hypothetical protein VXS06_14570 [Photobacterium toruni]|uniref:Uncharacterized protein n=1 Tax=Photobacterium toruni TaxID=1935446 RepID=A0ABU6L8S6_9GAMM|nr:hypothetical protein [Photobacterium toruni]